MKKKDIQLFEKTIHEVKRVITGIADERKKYHEEITKLRKEQREMRKGHNIAVKKQLKELLEVVDDMYELFTDLSNGNGEK